MAGGLFATTGGGGGGGGSASPRRNVRRQSSPRGRALLAAAALTVAVLGVAGLAWRVSCRAKQRKERGARTRWGRGGRPGEMHAAPRRRKKNLGLHPPKSSQHGARPPHPATPATTAATTTTTATDASDARARALSRIAALPGMGSTPLSALEAAPAGPLAAAAGVGGGGVLASSPPRARRALPAPLAATDGPATAAASAVLIAATLRDAVDPPPAAPPARGAPPPPLAARRAAVRAAFAHTWAGYVAHAWGADELAPVSRAGYDTQCGIGLTILDSLGTLALLRFPGELARARDWVAAQDWAGGRWGRRRSSPQAPPPPPPAGCAGSTFEVVIRGLGGLVSAHDLTGDPAFLAAAEGLAARLLPAFATPSGLPAPAVVLVPPPTGVEGEEDEEEEGGSGSASSGGARPHPHPHPPRFTFLAEAGSVQLEFVRLASLLGRPDLAATAERAVAAILDANPGGGDPGAPGLFPTTLALENGGGVFAGERHSVGGRADSFYEYLLKAWLLRRKGAAAAPAGERPVAFVPPAEARGGRRGEQHHPPPPSPRLTTPGGPAAVERLRAAWEAAMDAVLSRLVRTSPQGAPYLTTDAGEAATDHLACFLPGNLALGVAEGAVTGTKAAAYLASAAALAATCFQTAAATMTGLAPEDTLFTPAGPVPGRGPGSLLRPEVVESLFLLHRATGDPAWQDKGWALFTAWERAAKVPGGGYSGVVDVNPVPGLSSQPRPAAAAAAPPSPAIAWDDQQPSWWAAETLKYLWLLFQEPGGAVGGGEAPPLDGPDGLLTPPGEWVFTTEAHPLRVLPAGGRV